MIVSIRFEINPIPVAGVAAAGVLLEDQRTGAFWNDKAGAWQGKEALPPEDSSAFRDWLVPLARDYPRAGIWGSGPKFYPDFTGVGGTWAAYAYDLGTPTPTRIPLFSFVQPDSYYLGTGGGSAGR